MQFVHYHLPVWLLVLAACGDGRSVATDSVASDAVDDAAVDSGDTGGEHADATAEGDATTPGDTAPDLADAATYDEDSAPDSGDTAALEADGGVGDTTGLDVEWDVSAMLEGAATDIPNEVMAHWPALLGGRMTRHTKVTGLEFHLPGVISSKRLAATPQPMLKHFNGVDYWQVSGELSARLVDEAGIYYAVGPIDSQGVNHRAETFDAFMPTEENPHEPASHPRAGLTGAFFCVRWPVTGFTGTLVQNQAPGDAGLSYPQAPLAWLNVDAFAMLQAGYGVVTLAAGGSAYARKEGDGRFTVDTNPESGSGIFFTEEPFDPEGGVTETEQYALLNTARPVSLGAAFEESALPANGILDIWAPVDGNEEGLAIGGTVSGNFLAPGRIVAFQFAMVECVSDSVVVFKELVAQATGMAEVRALLLGWSGSGVLAQALVSGGQPNGIFQFSEDLGAPPSGGNFNRWNEPASGRRFDGFVSFAPSRGDPFFKDMAVEKPNLIPVDKDYPLQAPIIVLHGDGDVATSPLAEVLHVNAVARAWPASKLSGDRISESFVVLHLAKLSHQQRDQLFTAWDDGELSPDALWYDPTLGYAPESLNSDGHGHRLSDIYARQVLQNDSRDLASYAGDLHTMPRMTPLFLALFQRLVEHARDGTPLPDSHVLPFLTDAETVSDTTAFPPYPTPCSLPEEWTWDDLLACRDGLTEDSAFAASPFLAWERAAIAELKAGAVLRAKPELLLVPDVAAPLGYYFSVFGLMLRRDFTAEELGERYGDHAGYVAAFTAATDSLVISGLWDRALGQRQVDQAAASDVLAPPAP